MNSFGGDELDRDSAASESSSNNEPDGNVDEREDIDMDADADADGDADGDQDGDNEDNGDEEEDQEETQFSLGGNKTTPKPLPASQVSNLSNGSTTSKKPDDTDIPTSVPDPSLLPGSPSPTQGSSISPRLPYDIPKVRAEARTASVYDVVPTIAAPHSTSINAIAATPDLRWVFSGGADGFIRKFNWIETANGKSMLTVAQRHPFVDSVTKAGVLVNYWENAEESSGKGSDEATSISPVYSLATHHEGLWLLSGLESGGINLQSVRVEEGKQITCLKGHTSAVSVLNLAQDEQSVVSGSWDKTVLNWDLNTGQVIRSFEGSGGQISAIETRPLSALPVPKTIDEIKETNGTFFSDGAYGPRANGFVNGTKETDSQIDILGSGAGLGAAAASPADSLFGGGDADSLFNDDDNADPVLSGGNFLDNEDEFSQELAIGFKEQERSNDQMIVQETQIGEGDVDMSLFEDTTTNVKEEEGLGSRSMVNENSAAHSGDRVEAPNFPVNIESSLPHSDEILPDTGNIESQAQDTSESVPKADSTFLAASIDGTIRIWDKRQPKAVAKLTPRNVPPWCMNATWSPDGNFVYAGRRNGAVDEYSLHKSLQTADRTFKLPNNSGAVSAVRAMPNGRHLLCASYDIIRLYDLQQKQIFKHATVPFLIVPGHRTGVVSQLYIDPACRYLISIAGNRGWEGTNTEVLLGYEIGVPP